MGAVMVDDAITEASDDGLATDPLLRAAGAAAAAIAFFLLFLA